MRNRLRCWVLVTSVLSVLTAPSAQAQERPSLKLPVSGIERPHSEAMWLTQAPPTAGQAQVAQITAVQLKPTDKGLEVILETAGSFDEVLTSSSDNRLITDIPNAQLRLPKGGAFRQDNPTHTNLQPDR